MGVVIGVMIGYALGCRAGPEGWSESRGGLAHHLHVEEVRDFADGALAIARDLLEKRIEVITGLLGAPDDSSRLRPVA